MSEALTRYVSQSSKRKKHYRISNVDVFIKDPLPEYIDVEQVLLSVQKKLFNNYNIINSVDVIYVGQFEEFIKYGYNAMYKDGAIYVSNEQDDLKDMLDDIIHEYAHALEEKNYNLIYSDKKIQKEFLAKRSILENRLKDKYDLSEYDLSSINYNAELDDFFRNIVGYNKLRGYVKDIFLDSYSVTNINEYFATAFDKYFLSNRLNVKVMCPQAFKKIETILYMETYNEI